MTHYTILLKDYLENRGGSFPSTIESLFSQIPDFVYSDDGYSIKFSLREMFVHDNQYKEICAETETLFEYYLSTRLDEVIVEYGPKIHVYLKLFNNDLASRQMKMTRTEELKYDGKRESSNEGTDTDTSYVNPITKQTESLTVRDVQENKSKAQDTVSDNKTENKTITEDRFFNVLGKTNAELLEEIMQIRNIYLEALHRLDNLFMYVL